MSVHKREPVVRQMSNSLICRRRVILRLASLKRHCHQHYDDLCPFLGPPRERELPVQGYAAH